MKKLFFFAVTIVVVILTLSSCAQEEDLLPSVTDGIYFGKFNEWVVAYEARSGNISPLGYSFPTTSTITIDNTSFVAQFPDDYNPRSTSCFLSSVESTDYSSAIIGTDREFDGLHYSLNQRDISYNGGLVFAIRSLSGGDVEINIISLKNNDKYRTIGTISKESAPVNHRELRFAVGSSITNDNQETWIMTINSITSYEWCNLFDVYQVENGKKTFRFKVEVIDNTKI